MRDQTPRSRNRIRAYAALANSGVPEPIRFAMGQIAGALARRGYLLRTNGIGSARAFTDAVPASLVEEYLPSKGFRRSRSPLFEISDEAMRIASEIHPLFWRLSEPAQRRIARDVTLLLGTTLHDPVSFLLCWTADGVEGATHAITRATGECGPALALAAARRIQIFNLANPAQLQRVMVGLGLDPPFDHVHYPGVYSPLPRAATSSNLCQSTSTAELGMRQLGKTIGAE